MKRYFPSLFMLLLALISTASAVEPKHELPQRLRGRIAAMGGPAAGQTAFFRIQIERWADRDELRRLDSILVADGEEALLKAVADTEPAGWFKVGNGLRYYLRIISQTPDGEGGRLIRALTDRPIQVGEIFRGTRSRGYGFGVLELKLDADSKGTGSLIPAAKIHFKELGFEIESYLTQSYRLLKIEKEKARK